MSPKPRVFISSVVDGFQQYREAARRGVLGAGGEPILVNEDLPSDARSSRNACLDAVASSDIYVLLIGHRGGWTAPSGKFAIEEEYECARKRLLPILVFLQATEREPAAERLAARISDYVAGHFRRSFSTAAELERAVAAAVEARIKIMSIPVVSEESIQARMQQRPRDANQPTLRVVIAPERSEEVVTPVDLTAASFIQVIYELAHSADVHLLNYTQAKSHGQAADAVVIEQHNWQGRGLQGGHVWLSINESGVIEAEVSITGGGQSGSDAFAAGLVVRLDEVEERLLAVCRFAARFYDWRDLYQRHQRFMYNVGVMSIGFRQFTRRKAPQGSYGMNMTRGDHPIIVYERPRFIGREDLGNPQNEIKRVVALLERTDAK